MRVQTCFMLYASLLWLGVNASGCDTAPPPPDQPPPDAGVGLPTSCVVDQDCPNPALFFCNSAAARCEPACRTQRDCGAAERGQYALPQCDSNPLGCQCDEGRCVVALCSADSECNGQVCRNGRCVQPATLPAAASCRVGPEVLLGREGSQVRFDVLAMDAEGRPVVGSATWSALSGSVQGGGNGASATFSLQSATSGLVEAVQAQVGSASCRARVRVLAASVPAGRVRALLKDELTGRPLSGVSLVAADAEGRVTSTSVSDASGVALVEAPPGPGGTVSAFHQSYGYLTVAHDGPEGPADLALPLRRNPTDRYGGYRGTFINVPSTQDLHLAVAGLSVPDPVTDLSTSLLVGPTRTVPVNFNGQTLEVALPAGAYAVLPGQPPLQTEVSAQGLAGVCDGSLEGVADAEAAVAQGACGTRTAWALAGDIPPTALPVIGGGVTDPNQLLAQVLPLLRRLNSSVLRDVPYRLEPTPGASTGQPDYSRQEHFARVVHDYQQVPLAFPFAVRVPTLPRYRNAWADGVLVLGMAQVSGRGMVPLGLGVAANTSPADAVTDQQPGLPSPGLIGVRMAPAHHGLEGSPYVLAAIASSNPNDSSAGAASSALLQRLPSNRVPFDARGSTPVALSGTFLPVPEGARYNFLSEDYRGLAGRQLRFVGAPELSGTTLLRVTFINRAERRWAVLLEPSRAAAGLRLPQPPALLEDRTYYGELSGTRSPLVVQALALRRTPGAPLLSLRALLEPDGADLERVGELASAFSALDSGRPLVSWLEPAEDGRTLPPGSTVRVRVSSFRLGTAPADDGYVLLSLSGGAGCEGLSVSGTVDDSQGRGEISLPLPAACSGQQVRLTATLVHPDGSPLRPPVSSTRSVNLVR
jgi:hypothetical protein